jgi:ABC-2 type transport system permease protein
MSSNAATVGAAKRQLRRMFGSPPLLLPALMFAPLLLVAFAGGLSALSKAPGFHYYDYTAFIYVYVLLQGAASSGAITGVAVAQDFETGFARRMLLSTRQRWPLTAGYILSSVVRMVMIFALLTVCALVGGMGIDGDPLQFAGVFALAILINIAACLFAIGVALRVRSVQAGPMMQLPVLLITFLAPVYVTRNLMTGWLATVADYNPFTALYESGRGLMAGNPHRTALAFGLCGAMILLFAVWSATGMRKAESS